MDAPLRKFLTLAVLLVSSIASAESRGEALSSLVRGGNPVTLGHALGPQSFVPVEAKGLKNPEYYYVDLEYFRERGIEIPREGLTAEVKRILDDAWAYAVPVAGDPAGIFDGRHKTFYADRYGGYGVGANKGSGRVFGSGEFQSKGGGPTPLVGGSGSHSNGLMSLEEGIREVEWGQINHAELPWGGNRVVALISRGTSRVNEKGLLIPDVIAIREADVQAVRPAHYLEASLWGGGDPGELKRIRESSIQFEKALPLSRNPGARSRIESGVLEYADRLGEQYAASFALRTNHGGASPSNIELSGRFLDYGTQTAQAGYGKLQVLTATDPAGSIEKIAQHQIREFLDEIRKTFPEDISKQLPATESVLKRFGATYERSLNLEFLKLTGAPPHLAEQLVDRKAVEPFAKVLREVATRGAVEAIAKYEVPDRLQDFDLEKILVALADVDPADLKKVEETLAAQLPGPKLARIRTRFARGYGDFMKAVLKKGAAEGAASEALRNYIRESARIRNAKRTLLYRWKMMEDNFKLIRRYNQTKDPQLVWDYLDQRIADTRLIFKEDPRYSLTLRKSSVLPDGSSIRYRYNAITGTYELTLEGSVYRDGKGSLFGVPFEQLRYRVPGETIERAGVMVTNGTRFQMTLPLGNPDRKVELLIGNEARGISLNRREGRTGSISIQTLKRVPSAAKTRAWCILNSAFNGNR